MKQRKNMNPNPYLLHIFIALTVLFLGLGVFFQSTDEQKIHNLSYSDFYSKVLGNEIKLAEVDGQVVVGTLADDSLYKAVIAPSDEIMNLMVKNGVDVKVVQNEGREWSPLSLIILIFMMIFVAFLVYTRWASGGMGGSSKMFSIGRSKAQYFEPNEVKTKFKDVAGLAEAKEELADIVDFLKNPEKYKVLGAKIPRGVLLSGDPGNGKTLLARAVAGEAHCGFYSISGSDFIEVFVGVGASRVRDLFAQARKTAPCIVFIDEIDAIGKQRGSGVGGGTDERDQTLNQLLAEMDGFGTEPGSVIVLAATNRVDILDTALVRPGRFDRSVQVPFPDLRAREAILEIHGKNVILSPAVDFKQIARGTGGMSGADLSSLINEAALRATKAGKKCIDMDDFEEARDKIAVGPAKKSAIISDKVKEGTAYHEAGHTIISVLLKNSKPLHKVTILPRGFALGITWSFMDPDDEHTMSFEQMKDFIKVCFGGMIAEKIKYGFSGAGVASDLQQATGVARNMVIHYGMSALGPVSLAVDFKNVSAGTKARLDAEVEKIMKEYYAEADELLRNNVDKLELLAQELLKEETLDAAQVYTLLGIEPKVISSFVKSLPVVTVSGDDSVVLIKESEKEEKNS